jgi:hypothetical protein
LTVLYFRQGWPWIAKGTAHNRPGTALIEYYDDTIIIVIIKLKFFIYKFNIEINEGIKKNVFIKINSVI